MEKYEKINEKIAAGYEYMETDETAKACDLWLDAWDDMITVMSEKGIRTLRELEDSYQWSDFLSNYVQDLEVELHNAATTDEAYIPRRIKYCEELLKVCGDMDELIVENTRRAMAESYFELGNDQEGDRLFRMWLTSDPTWGWGYIGWSDCYHFGNRKIAVDLEKAEEIISKGLAEKGLRDRADVLDRASELYTALGKGQRAEELKKELLILTKAPKSRSVVSTPRTVLNTPAKGLNTPAKVLKIGRNDPCPCGSGKKYKKCCGK